MSILTILIVLASLIAAVILWRARRITIIYPPMVGLLYRDGRFKRELPPGRYTRFDPFQRTKIVQVSLAELPAKVGEITVLSKDQFSFRLALAPVVRVVDPRVFSESQPVEPHSMMQLTPTAANHAALHSEVSAAAMEVVGAMTLGEIFADQKGLTDSIRAKLERAIPGASIDRVLLTAINLPPETRKIFTDVERARMEGQIALERARGEQAALRALANAARLIDNNPALANLRLLQAIENSKGATTLVLGNAAPPLGNLGGTTSSSSA